MAPDREELVKIQYEQAYNRLRFLQNWVWQIPSVTAAIDGALILVAFRYVDDSIVRISMLLIGIFLTSALYVSLVKHRFFAKSTYDTILAIEKQNDMNHLQISTFPYTTGYWCMTEPNTYLEKQSAAELLKLSMVGSIAILLLLFIYSILLIIYNFILFIY